MVCCCVYLTASVRQMWCMGLATAFRQLCFGTNPLFIQPQLHVTATAQNKSAVRLSTDSKKGEQFCWHLPLRMCSACPCACQHIVVYQQWGSRCMSDPNRNTLRRTAQLHDVHVLFVHLTVPRWHPTHRQHATTQETEVTAGGLFNRVGTATTGTHQAQPGNVASVGGEAWPC